MFEVLGNRNTIFIVTSFLIETSSKFLKKEIAIIMIIHNLPKLTTSILVIARYNSDMMSCGRLCDRIPKNQNISF